MENLAGEYKQILMYSQSCKIDFNGVDDVRVGYVLEQCADPSQVQAPLALQAAFIQE